MPPNAATGAADSAASATATTTAFPPGAMDDAGGKVAVPELLLEAAPTMLPGAVILIPAAARPRATGGAILREYGPMRGSKTPPRPPLARMRAIAKGSMGLAADPRPAGPPAGVLTAELIPAATLAPVPTLLTPPPAAPVPANAAPAAPEDDTTSPAPAVDDEPYSRVAPAETGAPAVAAGRGCKGSEAAAVGCAPTVTPAPPVPTTPSAPPLDPLAANDPAATAASAAATLELLLTATCSGWLPPDAEFAITDATAGGIAGGTSNDAGDQSAPGAAPWMSGETA